MQTTSNEFVLLQKKYESYMADKANMMKFVRAVQVEFDKNSAILSDNGLSEKPIISKDPIWNFTRISEEEVSLTMKKTKAKFVEKVFGENAVYIPFLIAIRYFTETNNTQMINLLCTYTTVTIYSMLHRKYFTVGHAKREVMDYTINNLSNKYDIKRLGSLIKALEKLYQANHENYKKDLLSNDDDKILDYVEGLRTRINSFIKNIYGEFIDNYRSGRYVNVDPDKLTGEDEEFENERSSDSSIIIEASQSFMIWFVTNSNDHAGLKLAVNYNKDVSLPHLQHIVNEVKLDKSNKVEEIVASIVNLLVENQKNNNLNAVCNARFIPFVFSVFSRSNTSDVNIIRIKDNISALLEKYSEKFNNTNREATKIAYRKALLIYIAFLIQKQRCN
jgi:hypothetical protein